MGCDNVFWIISVVIIAMILFILKVSKESKIRKKKLELGYYDNKYSKRSLPIETQKIIDCSTTNSLIEDYFANKEYSILVYLRYLLFEFDNFGIQSLYWYDPEKAQAFKDKYVFFGLITLDDYYYIKDIVERVENELEKRK